jgi:carboxypeptidase Taq
MEKKLQELKNRLMEVYDLEMVNSLLGWDQSTYMPDGGKFARARQSALVTQLAHEYATDPEIGRLLDSLVPWAETLPYDSDDASLVRIAHYDYQRRTHVPARFMAELYRHASESYNTWVVARENNDFTSIAPALEKTLELSRQLADFFPGYEHIADPLINYADPGMKASTIKQLFGELRQGLLPITQAILAQPRADDSCLRQYYPEAQQLAFGAEVARQIGYDFERGRIDKTHHPFMTKFSLGDIRITTRVQEHELGENLFSVIHEAGHAMYELGIRMELEGTPLADGTSAGVHESQSRTWENLVGRSLPFWEHFYPRLQATFPDQLAKVPLETFYRAINKVDRSLIRTDADEVTYNLHVMLRFDLELELLEGRLAVRDLPEAWHARYQSDLGLRAPDDRDGVLQDVHWFGGWIGGAFQGYTLGNILGRQFFDVALTAHPEIPTEISAGRFDILRGWLTENLYQHGRKFSTAELVERVTGGPIRIEPYLTYLKAKYGALYSL